MKFNYLVFTTNNHKYLYDGNSSNLFSITDSFYRSHRELITKIEEGNVAGLDYSIDISEITAAIEGGYFIPMEEQLLNYWFNEKDYNESVARKEIKHVMVEITQSCNMRCKYCVYGGHYPKERQHNSQSIDEQTLINAAQLILDGASQSSDKIFNFYGGEPFLEFNKIASIVDHIIAIDPKIKFYFTTNGTLLNHRVAEWFVAHPQINLFVSFGGTPSEHDNLRITKNGNPTYNLIKKNLLTIKELNEKAYVQRVRFIFNLFTNKQLFDIDNLLKTDSLFSCLTHPPEISGIDCTDDDGTVSEMQKEFEETYKDYPNPIDEYIRRLELGDRENLFSKYFDDLFLTVHNRSFSGNQSTLSGVCRPFLHKIFVDINGDIHVCENYRFGADFGNVNSTIKLENIKSLLEDYKKKRISSCSVCWANKFCTLCFKDFGKREFGGKILSDLARCDLERNRLKGIFIKYCEILEKTPNILNHLDEYVIVE